MRHTLRHPRNLKSGIFAIFALSVMCSPAALRFAPKAARAAGAIEPRSQKEQPRMTPTSEVRTADAPLYFIANQGQADAEVLYYARTPGYTLWLTRNGLVFDMLARTGAPPRGDREYWMHEPATKAGEWRRDVARLRFKGCAADASVVPEDVAECRVNLFKGLDPSAWRAGIPTAREVRYRGLYPNIDLRVRGVGSQVEYDWILAPGAKVEQIRVEYEGTGSVGIDPDGNIVADGDDGWIVQRRPASFQVMGGEIRPVASAFRVLGGNCFGIEVAEHDPCAPLVIDPVISYSTYLGGGSDDIPEDIAADSTGAAVIVGNTYSTDFPTTKAYQDSFGGPSQDVFITKLSADGRSRIFSTYLGGEFRDQAFCVALDSKGAIYVAGCSDSTDFPLKNEYQGRLNAWYRPAFLTKLAADGSALEYSTFFGGQGMDAQGNENWAGNNPFGLAVDDQGAAYLTGTTNAVDFPLLNPIQSVQSGPFWTAFVTKFQPAGNALAYSTLLGGGTLRDYGLAIAVDSKGNAYVTGTTFSRNFPLANAYQKQYVGRSWEGFLTKINAAGNALVYSTYFGGRGLDWPLDIAVDRSGSPVIFGITYSDNLPVKKALQSRLAGRTDTFVAKFASSGKSLIFSTYLGGRNFELAGGIALDDKGTIWVAGHTMSPDFPLKNQNQDLTNFFGDAFVTQIAASGSQILYSTVLGGTLQDDALAITVDKQGRALITGRTDSTDFPLAGAVQTKLAGGVDAFVARVAATGSEVADWGSGVVASVTPSVAGRIVEHAHGPREPIAVSGETYYTVESFELPKSLQGGPTTIVPMDFDDDGDSDIIVVNNVGAPGRRPVGPGGGGVIVALRNDGAGHLQDATATVMVGDTYHDGSAHAAAADFNGDGTDDLYVSGWGQDGPPFEDQMPDDGSQDLLFLQKAPGRLVDSTSKGIPGIMAENGISPVADFDGDGDLDIYRTPGSPKYYSTPHFLINNGKGVFTSRNDNLPTDMLDLLGRDNRPLAAAALDSDRDGDTDLVVAAGQTLVLLLNDGKGVFTHAPGGAVPSYPKGGWCEKLTVADMDGDGWTDMMAHVDMPWPQPGKMQLLRNNRDGTFRDESKNIPKVPSSGSWWRAAIDMSGDGRLDYLFGNEFTGPLILLNKGNGRFEEVSKKVVPKIPDCPINAAMPFDANGDGRIDIFGICWGQNDTLPVAHVLINVKPF